MTIREIVVNDIPGFGDSAIGGGTFGGFLDGASFGASIIGGGKASNIGGGRSTGGGKSLGKGSASPGPGLLAFLSAGNGLAGSAGASAAFGSAGAAFLRPNTGLGGSVA
jgi:hypothetical protein